MIELLSGACEHPTVMKNMCAECGADLEQDMSIIPSANNPTKSKISIVHSIPELKVSSNVSRLYTFSQLWGYKIGADYL